ncbi:MAG TPA: phage baseplate assembly protein V [Candidatus Sulfotelmatobacter sp.]|nr:phage baseplate assembly protein V [Candidatus Sulfotelmatobacter sp.]
MSQLTASLMDRVDTRFYGKHRAFVADNADPENRGRLRLQIPDILGNDVVSGWALPCAPYGGTAGQGFFFIPDKDAGVWVEFEHGLLDYPVWVGTFWAKPGGTTEVPPPGDSQSPPTSKIIKTKNHTIELADEDGKETITITDAKNKNIFTLDKDGVKIQADKDIEVKATGGLKIQADKDIELKASGDLKITATNVKVQVSGSMEIS